MLKLKKNSAVAITSAAILAMALFSGCAVSKADGKYNSYIYDDSDRNVNFSIEYPENWNLVEQRGWDGDETSEASPDTGIQFHFSENKTETFTIAAMSFSPLSINQEGYKAEKFITDNNLMGIKYTDSDKDYTSIFYIFGTETDLPPHYFAIINMSTPVFEKYKLDIEKVIKSFKVLENDEATVPEEKTQSLLPTINIPVVREGTTKLLTANLTVSDLGYVIYLFEDFVLTSTDGGDIIHPAESSPIMKTITMGVVLADDGTPLPENKTEDGIYTAYHRVVTINHTYDITLSYPLEASEGGAILLRAMMDTVVDIESPINTEFLYGTWKVSKFLGFTAITKDDAEWPDGENIIGRTVIIGSDLFSTRDFGTEYAIYAVEIQNPVYRHTYTEKGYDFAKYLSPTADRSILELSNEDIRLINTDSTDPEIAGPALYLINNERLLISLNCDYFELEKVSSQIVNDKGYKTEEDFLNSTEGIDFQSVAYEAAKAVLCADADELAKYMLDPNEASRSIRGMTDVFENVGELTLVWSLDNIKSDNEVHASYRYALDGEDSFSYVTMELIKDSDVWKVKWLGIEK